MTKKGRGKRAATAVKGSVVTTQTNAIKGKAAPANNRKEKVKVELKAKRVASGLTPRRLGSDLRTRADVGSVRGG